MNIYEVYAMFIVVLDTFDAEHDIIRRVSMADIVY